MASIEDRKTDIRFVIEQVSRMVYFFIITKDRTKSKFNQDAAFLSTFYGTSHKQIVKALNAQKISVFTIAFFLHVLLSHFRVFSDPKKGDPRVQVNMDLHFDGSRALSETVFWLLVAGQDCDDANYTFTAPNDANPEGYCVYNGTSRCEFIVQVPGVGISQTDPRNQEALIFCHQILEDLQDGALPVHKREQLFYCGQYHSSLKPETFIKRPLKFGGWPKPKFNHASSAALGDSEGENEDLDDDGDDEDGE